MHSGLLDGNCAESTPLGERGNMTKKERQVLRHIAKGTQHVAYKIGKDYPEESGLLIQVSAALDFIGGGFDEATKDESESKPSVVPARKPSAA